MTRLSLSLCLSMIGGSIFLVVTDVASPVTLPPITHLEVIHDTGTGIPVLPFVGTALKRLDDAKNQNPPKTPVTQAPSMEQLLRLPLRSRLTPGVQPYIPLSEDIAKAMTQAMFIVGSDPASEAWLIEHEAWLIERNAVGYLVQAETLADVDRMLAAAGGLPMTVVNLDLLVQDLAISHYPMLITREGIFSRANLEADQQGERP